MTIILFLVDTSASMSQRTYLGARPTLLDVAKDAIEKFLKVSANCGSNFFVLFCFFFLFARSLPQQVSDHCFSFLLIFFSFCDLICPVTAATAGSRIPG